MVVRRRSYFADDADREQYEKALDDEEKHIQNSYTFIATFFWVGICLCIISLLVSKI